MSSRLILLVDDDRLILATLSDGLEKAGYQVLRAANGTQALEIVGDCRPDLAVLDVRMPDLSGTEVARRFAELEIPFLALTAYSETETVGEMVSHGALGYLVKPIDVPQVVPAIEAALERAAELARLRETQSHLSKALSSDRDTSTAIGILMERHRLTGEQAFDALRKFSRAQRRKLAEVSREIVVAEDLLNSLAS